MPSLAPASSRAQDYAAIVASPDRSEADRQTDQRRQPEKMLAFAGVKTGMKVLDMEANAGYSTELLARAVGPRASSTRRTAGNHRALRQRQVRQSRQKPGDEERRACDPRFEDPIPPEAANLDMITFFFAYHDVTYMPVDRAKMNAKMLAALKPGGYPDHRRPFGKPGEGITVAKTLHRIEEATLKQEIEAAGFKLVAQGDFLRHPEDPRDDKVFKPAIPVDEFVLKYQKPM